jgi:hypothetical protein
MVAGNSSLGDVWASIPFFLKFGQDRNPNQKKIIIKTSNKPINNQKNDLFT